MDIDTEKIDRTTIKSLASDTRVDILKKLVERRKMPSELSKEMNIAPSTVVEHLKGLESAGLVKKEETNHKWKYYCLTEKGSKLFQSKVPFHFLLSLTFGAIVAILSSISVFGSPIPSRSVQAEAAPIMPASGDAALAVAPVTQTDPILYVLIVLGLAIAAYSLFSIYRIKRN